MKKSWVIIFMQASLIMTSCEPKSKKTCEEDFFSEEDYKLTGTKLNDFNKKVAEYYTHKDDKTKQMIKLLWDSNNVKAILYLKNGQKHGPIENFDISGNLYYSGFYLRDKQTGVSTYYDATGKIKRFELYNNGEKIGNIDSVANR